MFDTAVLVSKPHHLALERLAAKSLVAEDFVAAHAYADRRCRIEPPAQAHCFVLRAEAAWRLGRREAALADLTRALGIAPQDIGALRRMMAWAEPDDRRAAAGELLAQDRNPATLRAAIALLHETGQRAWAAISVFDTYVAGWVAWAGDARVEAHLASDDGTLTSFLAADAFHPLAGRDIQATRFRIRRPPSLVPQQLSLTCDGQIVRAVRLKPNLASPSVQDQRTSEAAELRPPTVIVPIYGDTEATVACLESLIKARAHERSTPTNADAFEARAFDILVVDDASPEPELRRYIRGLAADRQIELLVNNVNLGFVGAINRALEHVVDGDVVLLNADTLVPPGFVGRLAAIAHSAPEIGTVTPFSNNGEFFSFPSPNTVNPIPSYEEVVALDRVAAETNGDIIEVPSGIGFCLYVKRECLERIGGLSENFERGYLEDVDLCLRARAEGYRNVCASSVFVGHHGSRSFQKEKRSLVLRNLGVLEHRFPAYRAECRAFAARDPLQSARAAFEAALPRAASPQVLIAAGRGVSFALAKTRANQLAQEGRRAILLTSDGADLRLVAADEGSPQSIRLRFDSTESNMKAALELARLNICRLELIDSNVPPTLIDLAHHLDIKIDCWITTGSSFLGYLGVVKEFLAPGEAAGDFARTLVPDISVVVRPWPVAPLVLPHFDDAPRSLVVLPAAASAVSWRTVRALAQRFHALELQTPIVVAGATLDDGRLMSFPNVFVMGDVGAAELSGAIAPYNPGWLLTDFEAPLFGHPILESARRAALPVAYCDWSHGRALARDGDLAMPGGADVEAISTAVVGWIGEA